jgi:RNA polymerase I-specific transcription-initiation factor
MSGVNPDTLATTIEQVAHELGERGYEIRSLHLDPDELEPDPERDPGSIISIYERLMSKLPSRGLRPEELASKVYTIKETAIDIGLANIGILKPNPSERPSLKSLGKFVSLDPALGISDGAQHLIDKWCETPQIPSRTKVPEKRKRPRDLREPLKRKFSLSQGAVSTQPAREILSSQTRSEVGLVTMSQPERGRQGTRKSHRAKTRRSGF